MKLSNQSLFGQVKHIIFWPIVVLLVTASSFSLIDTSEFLRITTSINDWIVNSFDWLFSSAALLFLLLCLIIYFSPLGKVVLGGPEATPLLSKWRWFSIALCTTIATGILFWGPSEPLYHYHSPPSGLGILPETEQAATFALSTVFLHWTFIPYGIYTLAGVILAFSVYNLKQPFSLGSMLYPLIGSRAHGWIGTVADGVSLFSLVAGMAASLGAGLIILAGGLERLTGITYSALTLGIMAVVIVSTFVSSAVSGLMKGIRMLSDINIKVFIGLAIFILLFGPTSYMLHEAGRGLWDMITHFFSHSLIGLDGNDKSWAHAWTIFYWSNWLAWTPVTAIFLARIGYGYSIREFIRMNLLYPALFSIVWMTIFSTTSLHFDISQPGFPLFEQLSREGGIGQVIFSILDHFPLHKITSLVFLLAAFLSFVTAADSNTSAMSSISATGISPSSPEPSVFIKVIWGVLIGMIAWVMIAFSGAGSSKGLDGIRMLSNMGGLPSLFLILVAAIGMIKLILASYFRKGPAQPENEN